MSGRDAPSQPPRLSKEQELLAEYDAACSNMGYPSPDDAQEWCVRLAAALRSDLAAARSAALEEAAKECDEEEERARRAASSAGYNDSYNLGEAGAASALASRIRALAGAPAEPEEYRVGDEWVDSRGYPHRCVAVDARPVLTLAAEGEGAYEAERCHADTWLAAGWRLVRRGEGPKR